MPPLRAPSWPGRLLAGLLAAAGVAALTLSGTFWRLDAWLYDGMLGTLPQPPGDDIVLVAIDDRSLSALGRWPWPRETHARLVERLTAAGVRGIALDLMISEPDPRDEDGDRALARALQASGRTVLPVLAEASEPDGPPIEILPLPMLIDAAAALGHAEIATDPDGVARQAYLRAGLGSPHWPTLTLALLQLERPSQERDALPGQRAHHPPQADSPWLWARDYRVLLPYANRDGFRQASYVDVLEGRVPDALLRDRWILAGVTTSGLARHVAIPGHGAQAQVSGVEYHAHLLDALARDALIQPASTPRQLLFGIALALLPLLACRIGRLRPRSWMRVAAAALLTLVLCLLMLRLGRIWYAPAPTLVVLAVGWLLWRLLRLRAQRRLTRPDALTRLGNRHMFDLGLEQAVAAARDSGRPLSLLLADVDHFRDYNARHGDAAGDKVLRRVAATAMAWLQHADDFAARYDGDAVAVVLPDTPAADALRTAEAILDDIRALAIPHGGRDGPARVSLSIGIATFVPALEHEYPDLVMRAESALQRARHNGGDRSHSAPEPSPQLR